MIMASLRKFGICTFSVLSYFTSFTQISRFPERFEAKAILFPSGDQDGQEFSDSSVKQTGSPPERETIQISGLPLRIDMKATRVPSGDQQAWSSWLS
jgi:hypothetical protein